MKPVQKVLTTCLWVVFVLAMVTVIGAGLWARGRMRVGENAIDLNDMDSSGDGSQRADALTPIADVPPFSLLDQDNKPLTRDALLGKPWVASFVFTHCAGPCPMMTQKMSTLQSSIPDSRVQLVTFTVDPERDTPAVLKQYAKEHDADESRWHFLTGDKDAIFALARGMLLTALPAQADTPIMHSEKFVLVDGAGKIRKYYDSKDPADLARLTADAARLAAQAKSTPVASRPVEPAP